MKLLKIATASGALCLVGLVILAAQPGAAQGAFDGNPLVMLQNLILGVQRNTQHLQESMNTLQLDTDTVGDSVLAIQGQTSNIDQAVTGIGRAVSVLDEKLDAVQNRNDTMFTMAADNGSTPYCQWLVISEEPRTVRAEIYNAYSPQLTYSPAVVKMATETATYRQGGSGAVFWPREQGIGQAFCRFTVLDGTKDDIRGSLYGTLHVGQFGAQTVLLSEGR